MYLTYVALVAVAHFLLLLLVWGEYKRPSRCDGFGEIFAETCIIVVFAFLHIISIIFLTKELVERGII